jgi:general stress protein 26
MAKTNSADLKGKFWKSIKSDMTVMIGLDGGTNAAPRPMTAQIEEDSGGPLWFFTSKDSELATGAGKGKPATATYASKGHDIFATIHGTLVVDNDRAAIDRLWNPYVAAWYEGGKDDPKLALLRYDADEAEIWEDASSLVAGIKTLLGINPQKDYEDKVATVKL